MRRWMKAGIAGLLGLLAGMGPDARAVDTNYFVFDDLTFGETTINFDTDANGTTLAAPRLFEEGSAVRDEYSALGVHFGGARGAGGGVILDSGSDFGQTPRSGSNFLAFNREAETRDGETPREPQVLTFDFPVPSVSIYVSGGFIAEEFRMDAYDRGGNLVATNSVTAFGFENLSVASDAGIHRVVISRESAIPRTTVTLPDVSGVRGGTVAIPIQVDGGARNLAAAKLTLAHEDAMSIGDANQVAVGGLLFGGLVEADLNAAGIVNISAASGRGSDGPGQVVVVTGQIRADAPLGTTPLRLIAAQLSDHLGRPILADLVDGSLTVVEGSAVVCGDLDGSGDLKITDAILSLQMAVGLITPSEAQTQAACGYPINVAFAVRVLRAVVGLSGPIEPNGSNPAPPSFTSSATLSTTTVAPGETVNIQAIINATGGPLTDGVVDVEIYDMSSQKVAQWFWEAQSFAPGQTRTYDMTWTAPAETGNYEVNIGVFTTGWAQNPHWNNSGGLITVGGG